MVGTLPMFCIEKPFCACTAQRNLRIAWCLQNRILVSVKIKLQAITSANDNRTSLIWLSIVQPPGKLITFQRQKLDPRRCGYKSAVSQFVQCLGLYRPRAFMYFLGLRPRKYMCSPCAVHIPYTVQTMIQLLHVLTSFFLPSHLSFKNMYMNTGITETMHVEHVHVTLKIPQVPSHYVQSKSMSTYLC